MHNYSSRWGAVTSVRMFLVCGVMIGLSAIPKGFPPDEVRNIRDEIKKRVQSLIANLLVSGMAAGDLASQDLL